MRYVIRTRVQAVKQQFIKHWLSGHSDAAKFANEPKGWFLWLEGSYEALGLGDEKPDFAPGDPIKITIEKDDPHEPKPIAKPESPRPLTGTEVQGDTAQEHADARVLGDAS